jgi:hypothetical protein
MGENQDGERSGAGRPDLGRGRTIDVNDEQALRYWADKLGVSREEIVQAIREVGPNITAVLLKLDAPQSDRVAPPPHPPGAPQR